MMLAVIDGSGVYGQTLSFAFGAAAFGSALLLFLYLWSKGRLDMDEEPKYQMMNDEKREESQDE